MSGDRPRRKGPDRLDKPALTVELIYEPSEDSEERLLRVYEFLLEDTPLPERKERA